MRTRMAACERRVESRRYQTNLQTKAGVKMEEVQHEQAPSMLG